MSAVVAPARRPFSSWVRLARMVADRAADVGVLAWAVVSGHRSAMISLKAAWVSSVSTKRCIARSMSVSLSQDTASTRRAWSTRVEIDAVCRMTKLATLLPRAACQVLPQTTRTEVTRTRIAKFPSWPVSYTHLRAHETDSYLVCRLLLEKKKQKT